MNAELPAPAACRNPPPLTALAVQTSGVREGPHAVAIAFAYQRLLRDLAGEAPLRIPCHALHAAFEGGPCGLGVFCRAFASLREVLREAGSPMLWVTELIPLLDSLHLAWPACMPADHPTSPDASLAHLRGVQVVLRVEGLACPEGHPELATVDARAWDGDSPEALRACQQTLARPQVPILLDLMARLPEWPRCPDSFPSPLGWALEAEARQQGLLDRHAALLAAELAGAGWPQQAAAVAAGLPLGREIHRRLVHRARGILMDEGRAGEGLLEAYHRICDRLFARHGRQHRRYQRALWDQVLDPIRRVATPRPGQDVAPEF